MGQHFPLLSLLTSDNVVSPVFRFLFFFSFIYYFELQPFGDTLNAWSHGSAVPALASSLFAAR